VCVWGGRGAAGARQGTPRGLATVSLGGVRSLSPFTCRSASLNRHSDTARADEENTAKFTAPRSSCMCAPSASGLPTSGAPHEPLPGCPDCSKGPGLGLGGSCSFWGFTAAPALFVAESSSVL
jgi:hypothetical protein